MTACAQFLFLLSSLSSSPILQRVFDIIHPSRRNLTAIRGYVRLGGLPDDPRTDPQDRTWFGPHDRLFTEEESEPLGFMPGPEHGEFPRFHLFYSILIVISL